MEENIFDRLVYFDHNVFDSMRKGDPFKIESFLEKYHLIPVYSNENLIEIQKSKGNEDKFIDLLTKIKARHLLPILDERFKQTGKANVLEGDPHSVYKKFLEDGLEMPAFGYGLSGMLQKMYGGLDDLSFKQIFSKGAEELTELLKGATESLNDEEFDAEMMAQIKAMTQQMPELLKDCYSDLANGFDSHGPEPHVKAFEEHTGFGPKGLNNIKEPNVLNKIWALYDSKLNVKGITLEKFFGLDRSDWQQAKDGELQVTEKVNAIYHQLNFIGYFRDTNMKKERRFAASFSDMTHAGMATFCRFFLCGDSGLVKKASAAFEYLNLNTLILHLKQS